MLDGDVTLGDPLSGSSVVATLQAAWLLNAAIDCTVAGPDGSNGVLAALQARLHLG
jgi:hypothetical protein